jgi:hypothetical protein
MEYSLSTLYDDHGREVRHVKMICLPALFSEVVLSIITLLCKKEY